MQRAGCTFPLSRDLPFDKNHVNRFYQRFDLVALLKADLLQTLVRHHGRNQRWIGSPIDRHFYFSHYVVALDFGDPADKAIANPGFHHFTSVQGSYSHSSICLNLI